MTSISLLRQHMVPEARAIELVRLNLMWAIGACICPTSVAYALKTGSATTVLLTIAAFFIALLLWTLVCVSAAHRVTNSIGFSFKWKTFRNVPIFLVLMTMLATGIEASAGAWLATYASRVQHGLIFTIAAPTCLWAGLLGSRLLGAFSSREDQLRDRAMALMLLVAISTVLLVVTGHEFIQLGASFLLGFGLGPLYPIFLGRVMGFYQGGVIFFLAGVSSAVMPWMTGIVSTRMSSLHAGLTIPTAGAVMLVILGLGLDGVKSPSFPGGKGPIGTPNGLR
jgi:fucose permease